MNMAVIKAVVDVLRVSILALVSCLLSPKKHVSRAWSSEYTFRLAKRLLRESSSQPLPWLRARQKLLKLYSPDLLKVTQHSEDIAGVPCISFCPKNTAKPDTLIIYFHGGGYAVGSADGYSLTQAKIALSAQAQVVGVEYRLAPENRVPAAQEDCLAVTEALIDLYPERTIILMGDSAGGGLCLATLNALGNANLIESISASVLISPWLTPFQPELLEIEHEQSDILDRVILTHWVKAFSAGDASEATYVDFGDIDVSALPPLYIQAAGAEVFSRQIEHFVEKLRQAEASHQYDVFDGQFHVFQTFSPLVREADQAISKIGEFVRRQVRSR